MAVRFNTGPTFTRTSNVPTLTAGTIVGWAKLSVDRNTYVTLCGLENSSTSETCLLQTDSDGTAFKIWKDTGYSSLIANLTAGTWFFFAFRFNGTNVAAFYATVTDGAITKVEETRPTTFTPNRVIFGDDVWGDQFNGCIDNIIIYDVALSDAEIEAQRWRRLPVRTTNLNLWWPTFPGTDRNKDFSGNGRDATVTGSPLDEDGAPVGWGGYIQELPYAVASVDLPLYAAGITSGEALGSSVTTLGTPGALVASGVKSGEGIGSPAVVGQAALSLQAAGIGSGEAVGTSAVALSSAGAVQAATGLFSFASSDTVGTTKTITCGFQPSLILFWATGQAAETDGITNQTARYGFGVATSTSTRYGMGTISTHASTAIDAGRVIRSDAIFATVSAAGSADGLIDISAFNVDGFTVIVDDQLPVGMAISYMAIAGSSITDIAIGLTTTPTGNVTGDWDTTGLSFQPDFLLLASNYLTTDPNTASASRGFLALGAATTTGQGVTTIGEGPESNATTVSKSYTRGDEVLAFLSDTPSTVSFQAALGSFLSNGFRLNVTNGANTAYRVVYVAVKGGLWRVDNLLTQTDTTTAITETGFGFAPAGTMLVSHMLAQSTAGTVQADGRLSIGAFTSASARNAQGLLLEDGLNDTDTTTALEADEAYINISTSSAIQGLMDVQSVDSDGFTLIMDDADPSQAFVWYFSLGATASALALSATGIQSGEALGNPVTSLAAALALSATGMGSSESVGAAVTSAVALSLSPGSIPSGEIISSPTVALGSPGAIVGSGIPSIERVSTGAISLQSGYTVSPGGLTSSEALGVAVSSLNSPLQIVAGGIRSTGVAGVATAGAAALSVQVGSISPGESFSAFVAALGVPSNVYGAGITSGERVGSSAPALQVALSLVAAGVVSGEAVGNGVAQIVLFGATLTGIGSGEVVGGAALALGAAGALQVTGVDGLGAVGSPALALQSALQLAASGISSGERVGSSVTTLGAPGVLLATGIVSGERVGVGQVGAQALAIYAVGMPSGEGVGAATLFAAGLSIQATGITSGEGIGVATAALAASLQIVASGIPSGGVVVGGLLLANYINPGGVGSGEVFGVFAISSTGLVVAVGGVGSTEIVGAAAVNSGAIVVPLVGIGSSERLGAANSLLGNSLSLLATGIGSGEGLGVPDYGMNALALLMIGIASVNRVGTGYLSPSFSGVEMRTYYVDDDTRTFEVDAYERTTFED